MHFLVGLLVVAVVYGGYWLYNYTTSRVLAPAPISEIDTFISWFADENIPIIEEKFGAVANVALLRASICEAMRGEYIDAEAGMRSKGWDDLHVALSLRARAAALDDYVDSAPDRERAMGAWIVAMFLRARARQLTGEVYEPRAEA